MMCCDYHKEGLSRTRRRTVRFVSDNQPSGTVTGPVWAHHAEITASSADQMLKWVILAP